MSANQQMMMASVIGGGGGGGGLAAPTLLDSNRILTNVQGTNQSTASITPAANAEIIVNVYVSVFSGTPPTITVSGAGLTWTQMASQVGGFTTGRQSVWVGIGAAPSSGALTIAVGASGATESFVYQVAQVTGVNSTSPVRQDVDYVGASLSPTTHTITLAALGSGGGVVTCWARQNGDSTTEILDESAGYTMLAETLSNNNSNPGALAITYKIAGTTTPGITSPTDFVRVTGCAMELAPA